MDLVPGLDAGKPDAPAGPDPVRARAKVQLRNVEGLPTIVRIELEAEGSVPGIGEDAFRGFAEKAKAGCPVWRALAGVPGIELSAKLPRPLPLPGPNNPKRVVPFVTCFEVDALRRWPGWGGGLH